jgi:hypothetical protein
MTQKRWQEWKIAVWFFWRYLWRSVVFAVLTVTVAQTFVHPTTIVGVRIEALVVSILILLYEISLWLGKAILRDARCGNALCRVEVETPWHRYRILVALSLWWGFAWRQGVGFFFLDMLSSDRISVLELILTLTVSGIVGMWWLVFHPFGRTKILISGGSVGVPETAV